MQVAYLPHIPNYSLTYQSIYLTRKSSLSLSFSPFFSFALAVLHLLPLLFSLFLYFLRALLRRDKANILTCLPITNLFIMNGIARGGVMVHCYGGKSRSAALVIGFLMFALRVVFSFFVFFPSFSSFLSSTFFLTLFYAS